MESLLECAWANPKYFMKLRGGSGVLELNLLFRGYVGSCGKGCQGRLMKAR